MKQPIPMLRAFVNESPTPEQAAAALHHKPVRNTLVSLIAYNMNQERLKQLSAAMGASSVSGSVQIRHCTFGDDGSLRLSRQAGIGQSSGLSVLPAEYVRRVVQTLQPPQHANGTVTGVAWEGDDTLAHVARPVLWKPQSSLKGESAQGNQDVAASTQLLFRVVFPANGASEFLECNACKCLFLHVSHYSHRACQSANLPHHAKTC
jgi:hypothetical protein